MVAHGAVTLPLIERAGESEGERGRETVKESEGEGESEGERESEGGRGREGESGAAGGSDGCARRGNLNPQPYNDS